MIPSSLIRRTGLSLVTSSVDSATLKAHTHTHAYSELFKTPQLILDSAHRVSIDKLFKMLSCLLIVCRGNGEEHSGRKLRAAQNAVTWCQVHSHLAWPRLWQHETVTVTGYQELMSFTPQMEVRRRMKTTEKLIAVCEFSLLETDPSVWLINCYILKNKSIEVL